MEYKYPEGIKIIIKNTSLQNIKNDNIYYQPCQNNCVPRGVFKVGEKAILKHHTCNDEKVIISPNFAYYLDFGEGYVSDWFSEQEIEYIAGKEELVQSNFKHVEKPPLGVMPLHIYERQRIVDLSRAIYEYSCFGYENPNNENWDILFKWADELKNRIELVRCLER